MADTIGAVIRETRLAERAKTEKEALTRHRRVRDEIRSLVEKLPALLTEQEEIG